MLPYYDIYRFNPEDYYNYETDNLPIEQIETDLRYLDLSKANSFGSGSFFPIGYKYDNYFGYSQDYLAFLDKFSTFSQSTGTGYFNISTSRVYAMFDGSTDSTYFQDIFSSTDQTFQFEMDLTNSDEKSLFNHNGQLFINYGSNSFFQNIKVEAVLVDSNGTDVNSGNYSTCLDMTIPDDNNIDYNNFYISDLTNFGADWNARTIKVDADSKPWYKKYDTPYIDDIANDTNGTGQELYSYKVKKLRFTLSNPLQINSEADIQIQEIGFYNNSVEAFPHYVKRDIGEIYDKLYFLNDAFNKSVYLTKLQKESNEGGFDNSAKIVLNENAVAGGGGIAPAIMSFESESGSLYFEVASPITLYALSTGIDIASGVTSMDFFATQTEFDNLTPTFSHSADFSTDVNNTPIGNSFTLTVNDGTNDNDFIFTHITDPVDFSTVDGIFHTITGNPIDELSVGYMNTSNKYVRLFTVNENGIFDNTGDKYVNITQLKQLTRKTFVLSLPGEQQVSPQPEPISSIISSVNGKIIKIQTYCESGDGTIDLTLNGTNIATGVTVNTTVYSQVVDIPIIEDDLVDVLINSSNTMSFGTVQLIVEQDI